MEIFNGNGFIYSCLKADRRVSYVSEEALEETYFRSKVELIKIMKNGKEFESDHDKLSYVFGVIYNCFRSSIRDFNLKKNRFLSYLDKSRLPVSYTYSNYDDIDNIRKYLESTLNRGNSNKLQKLSNEDKVSIFFSKAVDGYKSHELKDQYGVSAQSIDNAYHKVKDVFSEAFNDQ